MSLGFAMRFDVVKDRLEKEQLKHKVRNFQIRIRMQDCAFLSRLQGYAIGRECSSLRDWVAVWQGKALKRPLPA